MAAKSTFLVPGPWMNGIRLECLKPLLQPYSAFFAKHGIDLPKLEWRIGWHVPVHEALLRPKFDMPKDLKDTLVDVIEMSNAEAQNLLVELAAAHGWDLGPKADCLSCQDLAARAYVERLDLFDQARATLAINKTRDFTDFFDRACGDLAARMTPEQMEALIKRVKLHWKERNRGAFADIFVVKTAEWIAFLISHADLVKAQSVIRDEDEQRDHVRLRPELTDKIVFHLGRGQLSIATRYPKDADAYREIFGEVFWREPERYLKYTNYTTEPLMRDGAAVTDPSGIAGLEAARVKSFSLYNQEKPSHRMVVTGAQTAQLINEHLEDAKKRNLTRVGEIKLSFKLKGVKREVNVTLKPPNKLSLPRDVPNADVLHHFLVQKGFSVPPPRGGER